MLARSTLIVAAVLLLSACGYHLRGDIELPANLKNVYVEGASGTLDESFKKAMKLSSTKFAVSRKDAGLVVKIFNEDFNRRVLSLSSRGKSNEFELVYHLEYELAKADDTMLADRQAVDIRREYYNDQQFMIAKDQEEAGIRNEMYQQAVNSIMNRARVVLEAEGK